MPNFYLDNSDIKFHLRETDLSECIKLAEHNFQSKDQYDYAPQDMDDALDNYERVLALTGEIAGDFIAPRAADVDKESTHFEDGKVTYAKGIAEAFERLSQAGLMGMTLHHKYDGLNFPYIVYTMAIEMISQADASLMTIFGLQDIAETIYRFADEEVKNEYLPKFASGEVSGAMVLTEPDAGSDLQAVRTRATEVSDNGEWNWKLTGVKRFISNGCGDVHLVLARSEKGNTGGRGLSMFICEMGDTVQIRRIENKMGIKGSPTCEIQYHGTPAKLIGKRKYGLIKYVMDLMNGARVCIGAQSVGISQAAYNLALEYAHSREQFGIPIKDMPQVREMLANMKVDLEASRSLVYETARVVDTDKHLDELLEHDELSDPEEVKAVKQRLNRYRRYSAMLTPMGKHFGSEKCNEIASNTIQVMGGSGYMKDYDAERFFRDARITNIYEGTTQLQVVAAIGSIINGVWNTYLDEEAAPKAVGAEEDLLNMVQADVARTEECIAFVKESDIDYRDLVARDLVEMAMDLVISYLFLHQSLISDHKKVVARKFIQDMVRRNAMRATKILSGDKLTLTGFDEIIK